jgi:hypothetical protein
MILDGANFEFKADYLGYIVLPLLPFSRIRHVLVRFYPSLFASSKSQLYLGGMSHGKQPASLQCYDLSLDQQLFRLDAGPVTQLKTSGVEQRLVNDPIITLGAITVMGVVGDGA